MVTEEKVTYNNKQFFTDATLLAKVEAKEMTEKAAWQHQQERQKAWMKEEIDRGISEKLGATTAQTEAQKDLESCMKKYPNYFQKLPDGSSNPNFNPNDPNYKLANEIFAEMNPQDPKRLSKAIKRMEQITKNEIVNIDKTDEISLTSPTAPEKTTSEKTEYTMTDDDKEIAKRMYVFGGQINPKTGRVYTENEAYEKYRKSKQGRETRRVT